MGGSCDGPEGRGQLKGCGDEAKPCLNVEVTPLAGERAGMTSRR